MRQPPNTSPRRSPTVSYAIALFLLMLVTMQLWLLTATMNAYLGGDDSVIWPAAAASALCFALAAGLLRYVAEDKDSAGFVDVRMKPEEARRLAGET